MRTRNVVFLAVGVSLELGLGSGCVGESKGAPDAGDTGAPMSEVAGKVVDELGVPIANAKVGINGVMVATAMDGTFHLMAPSTYDVVVVNDNGTTSTSKRIASWVGLTLRAPTLQVYAQQKRAGGVVVTTTRTLGANERLAFLLLPNATSFASPTGDRLPAGQASGTLTLNWVGAPTMSGTIYALQYTSGSNAGLPTAFGGGDVQMFTGLTDKMSINASTWTFGISPPPTQVTLSIVYNGMTGVKLNVVYRPDPSAGFVFDDDTFKGETQRTFPIVGVNAANYKASAIVIANTPSGGVAAAWKAAIAPTMNMMTTASVTFPSTDITPMEPADGAMVDKTTTFSWSPIPNAAYRVLLLCPGDGSGALQTAVDILTSQTSVHLPDSSALGAVLAGMPCKWTVMAFPSAKTTDDLAGSSGWQAFTDSFRSGADSWNVASKARGVQIK